MKVKNSLKGGLSGAVVLTLIHETVRKFDPDAPRMDLLGMNALSKIIKSFGKNPPPREELFNWTMAGDVAGNAFYYALAGLGKGKNVLLNGLLLGLGAGAGAVLLPKHMDLNEAYSNRTPKTRFMTMGLYIVGGLVAASCIYLLDQTAKTINHNGHK